MKFEIIAEIGQAHEGSLGIAHSYIDALSKIGINVIKFQMHIAEAESSIYEPFRVRFSYQDLTRYDYWKRMQFTYEQWAELKQHCDGLNIEFLASPFSLAAVETLERLKVSKYKIGSGEINNHLMLDIISKTGKPLLLSSGMSDYTEIKKAISHIRNINKVYDSRNLVLFQCTTAYPTNPNQWGLTLISELKEYFKIPIGYSDHSGQIYPCLAAAGFGAEYFEFHVVFDQQMFGPDSSASLNLNQCKELVYGLKQIELSINNPPDKNDLSAFSNIKNIFEKSLAVNKNLFKGSIIKINDLEAKKPKGYGIESTKYLSVIGKKLKKDLNAWDFLNSEDIE